MVPLYRLLGRHRRIITQRLYLRQERYHSQYLCARSCILKLLKLPGPCLAPGSQVIEFGPEIRHLGNWNTRWDWIRSVQRHVAILLPSYANRSPTEYALRLPVPEKAQKQYNFVLLPKAGLGISDKLTASEDVCEPLVWTINDGPQKVTIFNEEELEKPTPSQDGNLIEQCLTRCLKVTPAGNLIQPEDAEFASSIPEAHRKGEKAYHVKAFRGSKDGTSGSLAV